MNIKTTFFFLFLSYFQFSWGQEITDPNLKLQSGQSFEVAKVFCINRDTLYLKLENSEQPYKVAMKDITYLDRNEFKHIRERHFNDPHFLFERGNHNFYKHVEIKSLGALFLGGIIAGSSAISIALGVYAYTNNLTPQALIFSGLIGMVPGTVVAVLCIRRAIHKKAFRGAKALE